jgi:predicted regulator of Ras-like GTPase activity (Roadblock/LC7/MglB family)
MGQMQQVLDSIADGPGVKFASVMTRQGLPLESSSGSDSNSELLSSATCQIMGMAQRIGSQFAGGQCKGLHLQLEQLSVLVEALESGLFLMVGLDSNQNVDGIRYIVQKSASELIEQT